MNEVLTKNIIHPQIFRPFLIIHQFVSGDVHARLLLRSASSVQNETLSIVLPGDQYLSLRLLPHALFMPRRLKLVT